MVNRDFVLAMATKLVKEDLIICIDINKSSLANKQYLRMNLLDGQNVTMSTLDSFRVVSFGFVVSLVLFGDALFRVTPRNLTSQESYKVQKTQYVYIFMEI